MSVFIVLGPPEAARVLCVSETLETALIVLEQDICGTYECASMNDAVLRGFVQRSSSHLHPYTLVSIECRHVADRRWSLQRVPLRM